MRIPQPITGFVASAGAFLCYAHSLAQEAPRSARENLGSPRLQGLVEGTRIPGSRNPPSVGTVCPGASDIGQSRWWHHVGHRAPSSGGRRGEGVGTPITQLPLQGPSHRQEQSVSLLRPSPGSPTARTRSPFSAAAGRPVAGDPPSDGTSGVTPAERGKDPSHAGSLSSGEAVPRAPILLGNEVCAIGPCIRPPPRAPNPDPNNGDCLGTQGPRAAGWPGSEGEPVGQGEEVHRLPARSLPLGKGGPLAWPRLDRSSPHGRGWSVADNTEGI